MLAPHQRRQRAIYDRLYMPRNAHTTGDIDIHELAVDEDGQMVFVNTKFSCLATLSPTHGFRPLWKPSFISSWRRRTAAISTASPCRTARPPMSPRSAGPTSVDGWRDRRHEGGVLVDIASDRWSPTICRCRIRRGSMTARCGCSIPAAAISGRVDPKAAGPSIAFCPGFLRGLCFHGEAMRIVATSLPRDGAVQGPAAAGRT